MARQIGYVAVNHQGGLGPLPVGHRCGFARKSPQCLISALSLHVGASPGKPRARGSARLPDSNSRLTKVARLFYPKEHHWRKEVVQRMNDNIAGSPFLGGGVADG